MKSRPAPACAIGLKAKPNVSVMVASPSAECSACTWKSPAYQPLLALRRCAVVGGRLVRLVRKRRIVGELDLDAPADLAVRVAERLRDDRRKPQLDCPLARLDRARDEAARRLARLVGARVRDVGSLALEALVGDDHVGMAGSAPAAELVLAVKLARVVARLVEPEIERVPRERPDRRVPAVLHADGGGAGGHVERQEYEAALLLRGELAGEHLARVDRGATTGGRAQHCRGRLHGDRVCPGRRRQEQACEDRRERHQKATRPLPRAEHPLAAP